MTRTVKVILGWGLAIISVTSFIAGMGFITHYKHEVAKYVNSITGNSLLLNWLIVAIVVIVIAVIMVKLVDLFVELTAK